jgi:hypothetical protein
LFSCSWNFKGKLEIMFRNALNGKNCIMTIQKKGVLFVCLFVCYCMRIRDMNMWISQVPFIYSPPIRSWLAPGPTLPLARSLPGDLRVEVRPSDRETDCSPPSSSGVRNTWSSAPVYPCYFMMLKLR